ncbi:MAG: hypothetical protein KGH79_03225 [Patescibacteria group bacterium]|nr:hypothetical protein [Patescibacteria group bacterium]
MKKFFTIIFGIIIFGVSLYSTALPVHADCVNNLEPGTGRPCITVTNNPNNGSSDYAGFGAAYAQNTGSYAGYAQTGSSPINGNPGYTPLEPIPGLTTDTNGVANTFPNLIGRLFTIGIIVGALMAVLMLTIGGIQYMVSEAVPIKTQGLSRARNALWGILLIAMSWLILHTINPQLLIFNLNPCPAGNCQASGPSNAFANAPTGYTTPASPACGNYSSCSSDQYCATVTPTIGSTPYQLCISNSDQTASKACSSSGGTWTQGITGTYCFQENYKTQKACETQGYQWKLGFLTYQCESS